jgi:predicted choloylglycine hydrolase
LSGSSGSRTDDEENALMNESTRHILNISVAVAVIWAITATTSDACTVFVMTDGRQVLFCNNEDYSNPNTRMWFIPGAEGRHGGVYVGFDDGWGQGGCNTEGLAYGWVAGYKEKWERPTDAQTVRGNSCQRMLETCATVEDAVAFYRRYWEESFSYGKLIVADRSGKSVLLEAKDGRLVASVTPRSQGIGHRFDLRGTEASLMLAEVSTTSVPAAERILNATLQDGPNATKYSVIYDLKSGEINLYRFREQSEPIRLNLTDELKKGPHYYDIPTLRSQLGTELRPLTEKMKLY